MVLAWAIYSGIPLIAMQYNINVPLRTRRVLLLYKAYGNSALQVLNRLWLNSVNIRAVVFQLFQKMVILPPNPVGFRLTYTQL